MSHRKLCLRSWIDSRGVTEVAQLLEVDPSTVRHWRRGHCLPKDEQKLAIKKASRGAVSISEMIETYFKRNAGKEGI